MPEHSGPPTPATDTRTNRRARRATRIARPERAFNLLASGYSYSQIAKMVRTSVATVRREIDRALAERPLDPPECFAQVQVARLLKALRIAEAAVELGELKAVETYLRVVAALDRYHELAAGPPPPADRPMRRPAPCPLRPGRWPSPRPPAAIRRSPITRKALPTSPNAERAWPASTTARGDSSRAKAHLSR